MFSGSYGIKEVLAKRLAMQHVEVALLSTLAGLSLLLSYASLRWGQIS